MNLLDYINPFNHSEDTITLVSVLAIFSVAILSIAYLFFALIRFKIFFKKNSHEIADSAKLKDLVFEFKSGLIDYNGQKKSFTSFQNKVSKSALLNVFFNDKVLNSISNMLVGLGILGTFLGLSSGVSGFVMDSTETIKDSIGELLGGMGTAFISSIWGMFSSLIFIFIYQLVRHTVALRTDRFYAAMDQEFLISEIEHEKYHEEQLKKSLREVVKEYFVQDEDGQERAPKYYFRELLLNSKNQTSSLSTFADDLAGLLEEMMDKLLDINSEKFKEIIDEKLMPILEKLRQEKEESSSGALEGVLNTLQDSMRKMLNDFKESITGETKGEMESLAGSLGNVTEALAKLPSEITGLSSDLTKDMNEIAITIKKVAEDISREQDRSEQLRKKTMEESNERLKTILDNVGDNVGSLIDQQSTSAEKLKEVLKSIDDIVSKNNQSIDSFHQLLTNSEQIFNNIQSSSLTLSEASKALLEGAGAVESNNKQVKEAVQTFVSSNNVSIEKIRLLQNDVINKTKGFLNQFAKMEEGVDSVFEKFNEGLEGYTENLNNALSGSIGKYVDSSTAAIGAINGLTRDLTEAVDGLTDVIVTTNK